MGNKLHYIALQLAGRVSAALRGGFGGEGSEVELETGDWSCAVGVRVGVSGRGCGTCLSLYSTVVVVVVVVSFVGNTRESKIGRDRWSQSLDGQMQIACGRYVWQRQSQVVRQRSFKREQKWEPAICNDAST